MTYLVHRPVPRAGVSYDSDPPAPRQRLFPFMTEHAPAPTVTAIVLARLLKIPLDASSPTSPYVPRSEDVYPEGRNRYHGD